MAENRRRILEAAGRLFREKGFDSVTVAEVMQAAGLTHGGFYGHFKSKDDLIAETLASVFSGPGSALSLEDYAASYLTPKHRDNPAGGCPVAGLGSDTLRQAPQARAKMTAGIARVIDRLARGTPGRNEAEKRRAAVAGYAAMVGALVLSRVSDDPKLSRELLDDTRDWIAHTRR
jgi:TetR/AcrR family transcriptional repressor of nem operon